MKPGILTLLCLIILWLPLKGGILNTPTNLEKRSDNSELIVEAQIVSQQSYWSNDGLKILTANELLVYKIFKGSLNSETLLLISEGGVIGDILHTVQPNVKLQIGQIGLFFLNHCPADKTSKNLALESSLQFYPDFLHESFIEYDLQLGLGKDQLSTFVNIEKEVYKKIEKAAKRPFAQMNQFTFPKIVKEDSELKSTETISVDCIYPNIISAGTNSILTITGSGFGQNYGSCRILMKNPDTGGEQNTELNASHIVVWTDELIEVKLPTKVGSGPVTIVTNNGASFTTQQEVTVNYACATAGTHEDPTYLLNQNGQGGYTFKYSTNTNNGGVNFATSQGTGAVERAVSTLREEVGFNININGTTFVNTYGDDGVNIISYDNNSSPISAAGLLYAQFKNCGNGWEVVGMDMVFRRSGTGSPPFDWNYGPGPASNSTLDLESVALHEFLHGAQLKHVIESDAALFFAYGFGTMRREPVMCSDLLGNQHIMQQSINYSPNCENGSTYQYSSEFIGYNSYDFTSCPSPTDCGGGGNTNTNTGSMVKCRVFLEGSFNGTFMENNLCLSDLIPYSQPFNIAPWYYNGNESVSIAVHFPPNTVDWILVQLRSSNNIGLIVAERAALLDNEGNIMELDGTEGVSFDGVAAGEYYLTIHHRTHLSVASDDPISLGASDMYDFTQDDSMAMGSKQLKSKMGKYVMYSGDYDGNGVINNQDFNLWGNDNASVAIYHTWDGDGNGVINNKDYNLWSVNKSKVGLSYIQY